jgi:hypothetical protein
MEKKILFAFLLSFLLIGFASAIQYSYQEDSNESSYNQTQFYIYENYTKPTSALDSSTWRIAYRLGNNVSTPLIFVEKNLTITDACWNADNSKLIFRISSYFVGDGPQTSSYDCFNGTDFEPLEQASSRFVGCDSTSYALPPTLNRAFDGIWLRDASEKLPSFKNHGGPDGFNYEWGGQRCVYSGQSYYAGIEEDAMNWEIPEAVTLNIIEPTETEYLAPVTNFEYNISGDYVACSFNDGTTTTSVVCGDDVAITSNEGSNTWSITAEDLVGQNITESVTFTVSTVKSTEIYKTMDSSGAGLGKFLQYMTLSIPLLIIGLIVAGIIITVALGVAFVLKGFMIKR